MKAAKLIFLTSIFISSNASAQKLYDVTLVLSKKIPNAWVSIIAFEDKLKKYEVSKDGYSLKARLPAGNFGFIAGQKLDEGESETYKFQRQIVKITKNTTITLKVSELGEMPVTGRAAFENLLIKIVGSQKDCATPNPYFICAKADISPNLVKQFVSLSKDMTQVKPWRLTGDNSIAYFKVRDQLYSLFLVKDGYGSGLVWQMETDD